MPVVTHASEVEIDDQIYLSFGIAAKFAQRFAPAWVPGFAPNRYGESRRMAVKVTEKDVERVAELAHLELAPQETGRMLRDLNAILDYVAELNELDTTGVAPLEQVSELGDAAGSSAPRADQQVPSLKRDVVMSQAPESDGAFFKVPKVIER